MLFKEEDSKYQLSLQHKQYFMTAMLWFLWVFHNFYMVIILLNFLISIVSKAHTNAIDHQIEVSYSHKFELNYDYDAIKKFFKMFDKGPRERDLFIIANAFKEDKEDE